jgi:hypothetical protein
VEAFLKVASSLRSLSVFNFIYIYLYRCIRDISLDNLNQLLSVFFFFLLTIIDQMVGCNCHANMFSQTAIGCTQPLLVGDGTRNLTLRELDYIEVFFDGPKWKRRPK